MWKSVVERCCISIKNTPWLFVSTRTPGDDRYLLIKASDSGATSMEIKITGIKETDLCIGAYHGWLLLKNKNFQEVAHVRLSMLNPLSGARIDLPVAYATDVTQLHLSSAPATPGCIAVAKGSGDCTFRLWRHGDKSWTNMRRAMHSHYSSRRFVDLITFRRQVYGLDDANEELLIVESGRCGQLLHPTYWELPSPAANVTPQWTSHSKHLVESVGEGDLWYVMICRDAGVSVSNSFVFRWHPENMTWSEVKRLDGVALLLDRNHLVAVSAGESGCRENCIYIASEPPAVSWRVCDRNDHNITNVSGTVDVIPDNVSEAFWIIPS